jgi:stage II sporulation protein E
MNRKGILAKRGGFDGMQSEWTERSQKWKTGIWRSFAENRMIQWLVARKWSFVLVAMGFLLSRATILEGLSPFALAYFAVMFFFRRDLLPWIFTVSVCGSLMSESPQTGFLVTEMLVFLLVQKAIDRFERSDISTTPVIVFGVSFLVHLFTILVSTEITWYEVAMSAVQALLSAVLTLIFIQAVPVFTLARKSYQLKTEEIVSLIILLASVMTGTVGWLIGGVTIEHVLSRYLILLFALVGGAPLGASVGVTTGLILSLANVNAIYQMSLLAFSGLLAGMLKEGGRMSVAFGMLLGSTILSVYIGSQTEVLQSVWESLAAIGLLLLTPRGVIRMIAKYVPGTNENLKSQQDYARRVRDVTASRVEQFSKVFLQLSNSFSHLTMDNQAAKKEEDVGHFMNAVAAKTCAGCFKRAHCWDRSFYQTYSFMTEMMTAIEMEEPLHPKSFPASWKKACVRTDAVLTVMRQQYDMYKSDMHWKKQISDSRQLVAEQLSGVSQVMEDLAKEIKREGQELFLQEEQIRHALEELGLSIHSIEIINLDVGKVEIEMVHPYTRGYDECRKIIAPLLSDILREHIAVKSEERLSRGEGYSLVVFGSAKEYEIETGIAGMAMGGDMMSGDSYSMMELGNGKFAVALSDGMGNGERAREESSAALSILEQLLQSGMDERLAIKSVNSVLLLRSPDEMYATVDVALIDLYSANTTFVKIGSTPSFIKRGTEVIPIYGSNLPVGIVQEIDVDLIAASLQHGDMLVMMTDGIYDAPDHAVNKELWMKRMIHEIDTQSSQEFADCLLERVVRYHHGDIHDDMTVLVARIEKRRPEWATIRMPGFTHIDRPKTVS